MSGPYLGDYQYGATLYIYFNTFSSVGASVTLTGLALADIQVYKAGSVTQRASTSGFVLLDTDGIDFDSLTGIHGFSIDTSDNTTAGFWGPGNDYTVVIASVTIDGQTVNFVAGTFSIENRASDGVLLRTTIATLASQTSFTLTAGSADNSAYLGATIVISDQASIVQKAVGVISAYTGASKTVTLLVDPAIFTMATGDYVTIIADRGLKATVPTNTLDVSAGGEAGLDWANVGSPTTSVGLTNTTVGIVTLLNGLAASVITATSIATGAITAAKFAASAIDATAIATGAITAAKFAASAIDATAIATGALTAAKFAAGAFDAVWTVAVRLLTAGTNIVLAKGTGVTGFTDLSAADVNAEVDTALADVNLDHLVGTAASIPAIVSGTYIDQLMDDGTAVYDRTTDSLQAVRDHATTIKTETASILDDTDDIGVAGAGLTAIVLTGTERNAMATALLDLANGVETGKTVRQALKALASILAGEVTGSGSGTEVFQAFGNAGTTRVTVTVDSSGNRSDVTVS